MNHKESHKKFFGNISKRLILGMSIVALVPILFAGYVSYMYSRTILVDTALEHSLEGLESVTLEVDLALQSYKNSVLFLAETPPIQGVIRAKKHNGVDPFDGSSIESWEDRLAVIFEGFLRTNPSILQARYLDESGQELVRVESYKQTVLRTPKEKLQNKGDRYYFIDGIKRKKGEVYVSPLDLNKEGTPPKIQVPHTPVIRYATPIFDESTGEKKGMIILNIQGDHVLDVIRSSIVEGEAERYVVSSDGYFFVHPDSQKEWGGPTDLDTGVHIVNDFSVSFASFILSGVRSAREDLLDEYIVSYAPIYIDDADTEIFWVVYELLPKSYILEPITILRNTLMFIAFGFVCAAILFAILFSRTISVPIKKITNMAIALAQGNLLSRSRVTSHDELGFLSDSFNAMADNMLSAQSQLEQTVAEKTKDLHTQLQISEETRKAVMNILRDVEDQKSDLENMQRATINLMEDINLEKENVEKERDKIDAILQSIGDGVFVIDDEGVVFMYNAAAESISGFTREEVLERPYHETLQFVYEKEDIPEDTFITSSIATGEIRELSMHCALRRKDGGVVSVSATAAPLKDKDEQHVIGSVIVFRDISKEAAIDRAKTEFVSLASHQLRTPLSTINWYAEMLLDGDAGELSQDQQQYIEEIYTGNQRMVALVNSLLNVSRLELGTFAVSPEDMNLVEEAESVLKELAPQIAEKNMNIHTNFSDIPTLMADRSLTRMIFQNLLTNALKYTPSRGDVTVSIADENDSIHISVADTGYGIPHDQQDKIFTKLFRADNVKEKDTTGTGLGLYIIKSIVDHVGGKIWFESVEEKGTTFHVFLPRTGMEKREGSKRLA